MEADARRNIVNRNEFNWDMKNMREFPDRAERFANMSTSIFFIHHETINIAPLHKSLTHRRAEDYRAENSAGAQKLMANLFAHTAEILNLRHFFSLDLSPRKHASHMYSSLKRTCGDSKSKMGVVSTELREGKPPNREALRGCTLAKRFTPKVKRSL